MPTIAARIDVEAPAIVAASGVPHRYSYAVARTVALDPILQIWKGPTSTGANLVFEITQEGYLTKGIAQRLHTAASQAAMLALVAYQGDLAKRTDEGRTYYLNGTDATVLANWVELFTGSGGFNPVSNMMYS